MTGIIMNADKGYQRQLGQTNAIVQFNLQNIISSSDIR